MIKELITYGQEHFAPQWGSFSPKPQNARTLRTLLMANKVPVDINKYTMYAMKDNAHQGYMYYDEENTRPMTIEETVEWNEYQSEVMAKKTPHKVSTMKPIATPKQSNFVKNRIRSDKAEYEHKDLSKLTNSRIAVFDLETTGVDAKKDEIIQ